MFDIGKIAGVGVRRNPAPRSRSRKLRKLKQAVDLYEDFSGNSAEYVERRNVVVPDVALKIGQLDGVMYTTNRDGKTERYIHEFKKTSRPLLAVSSDGKNLILIGGSYQFTDAGISDI